MNFKSYKRILAACLGIVALTLNVNALEIVKKGKTNAKIVIPVKPDKIAKQSAEWLQKYVKKCTGAVIPIVPENKDDFSGPRVSVGATDAARKAGVTIDELKYDACRMVVKGNTLFLLGRDDPGVPGDPWMAAKGTCRAVTAFLEDYCGVRWFIKGDLGEHTPWVNEIIVPDELERTIKPAFIYATGNPYGVNTPASYANNYRVATRRCFRFMTGHTWTVWVPVDKYYKDHPEYFALINGRRSDSECSHLCTSNPDVKQIIVDNIRKLFDKGYDLVPLAQADGARCCECDACKKKYGAYEDFTRKNSFDNPCERIQIFHKEIADECLKSHPDKKVLVMLYDQTRFPSKQFDKYPKNVMLELCEQDPPDPEILASWQGKADDLAVYVYWWGTYHAPGLAPKFTAEQAAETIRYLRDNNVRGLLIDGIAENWGLEGHSYYAAGKLLGNPDLEPQELVKEYCTGIYGPAAGGAMRYFFKILDAQVAGFKNALIKQPNLNNKEAVYAALYSPTVIKQLDGILARAEKLATNKRNRMWVGLTRLSFDYLKYTANVYALSRAFQVNDSLANLKQLEKAVLEWRAHRDKILNLSKEYLMSCFTGWYWWRQQFNTGGYMKGVINGPFLWDYDKMKAKYASGKGAFSAPKIIAPRLAKAPVIDGVINEAEWKAARPEELGMMSGSSKNTGTTVRVAFDEKNLYVAFKCNEPKINSMKLMDLGRDGGIWGLDCVEIFLAPQLPSQYMHMVIAPREGAYYDGRVGYIESPIHPLYGKHDKSWNPTWKYAFRINPDKKSWILEVEMPFAELGTTTPKVGERWKANFGRERFAGKNGAMQELFLWSPNMLSNKFCEPLCFGDLYFEKAETK